MKRKPHILPQTMGGQAVVEGIMIRSANAYAVAVRKPDGNIVVKSEGLKKKNPNSVWKKPFFRGVASFGSMLALGMKAINFSASFFEDEPGKTKTKKKPSKGARKKKQGLSAFELVFSIGTALALTIILYKALPLAIAGFFKNMNKAFANTFAFNAVDAIAKIIILILVMWSMGFLKDIRRMYQYHGAEHMAVFTYEARKALTVKNAQRYDTLHPRCGTNFLILVFIVSLFFFLSINPDLPFWIKLTLRIALLPLIAAVTYEIMRFGSKHMNNPAVKAMMLPGLWLQRITTKRPDKDQLEVALVAVKEVLAREEEKSVKARINEIKKDLLPLNEGSR